MSCNYTYNNKTYTEQEFKRLLATGLLSNLVETNVLTGLDISNLAEPSEFAVIDQKYDDKLKDAQVAYKGELDANEDVVKLRNYLKENGVEGVIIGQELANKLDMTPLQLFAAKERLITINVKYRNQFDDISKGRQIEKDLIVGNPVQVNNKEGLEIVYQTLFNNTQEQAKAAAEITDKTIGQIAKRSKRTKSEVYETITFDKTTQEALKVGENTLLQNSDTLQKVARGFQLEPTTGFGVAFKSKNGKATAALASSINKWLKTNDMNDLIFVYEKTYGTVNAIPKSNVLFQNTYKKYVDENGNLKYDNVKRLTLKERLPEGYIVIDTHEFNNPANPQELQLWYKDKPVIFGKDELEILNKIQRRDYDVEEFGGINLKKDVDSNFPYLVYSIGIDNDILNQSAQAAIELSLDGQATIFALSNPNVSSPLHELAHLYEKYLNVDEQRDVLKWAEKEEWDTETSEKFARGFEKYLSEGKAPNSALREIFESFKQWLTDIYNGIVNSAIDIELSDKMRDIYARMLGEKFQERPVESKPEIDQRLVPANPNDFNHKKVISQATNQYDYVDLLIDEQITKEGIIEAVASVYGIEYAQNYASGVEYRIDGDISKIENMNAWLQPNSESLVKAAYASGDLLAAIDNDLLPIGDTIQLIQKYGNIFNATILNLTNQKIQQYTKQMNTYSEVEDVLAANQTEISEEDVPEIDEQYVEPAIEIEQEEEVVETPKTSGDIAEGQEVTYKGETYNVESIDTDGMLNLRPAKGGKLNYAYPQMVQAIVKEQIRDVDHLIRVAERMQQLLPDVKFEFITTKENWKGRFKDGKVQINRNLAILETPIHEFLHPFVAAVRLENPTLYNNLVSQLDPAYLEEVRNLPQYEDTSEEDKVDEALVRNLSDNIKDTFNEDGTINEEKLQKRQQSIIDFIYGWLRKIYNLIFKTEKNVKFDTFINNLQNSNLSSKYRILEEDRPELWKSKLLVFGQDKVIVINRNNYNQEFSIPEKIFEEIKPQLSEEDYTELVREGENAIRKAEGRKYKDFEEFSLVTYNKKSRKLTFYKAGSDNRSRQLVLKGTEDLKNHVPQGHLQKFLDAISDSDPEIDLVKYEITPLSDTEEQFAEGAELQDYEVNRRITVGEIPASFSLNQIADLMIGQDAIKFDLSTQAETLSKLEAYSYGDPTDERVMQFKEKLKKKLAVLEHTAKSRIYKGSTVLSNEVSALKDVLFNYDDVSVFEEYVKTGLNGLADAHRILREIRDDIKQGNLTLEKVNELNRNFQEFNALYGVYSDVENIFQEFEEYMDDYTVERYDEVIKTKNRLNNNIKYTAGQLVTEWLYPTYLQQMQYVVQRNPDYVGKILTKEQFANKLRIADKDASIPSYYLGAMINSRDEVNATLGVALSDRLTINSNDEVETSLKFQDAYQKFLKDKGLPNNVKEVEKYYKDHYLRKASIWEQIGYDTIKKEPKYAYVERWAFIQEFNEDEWDDNLRKEIDKWKGTPEYYQKILDWHSQNSINDRTPNEKYRNKDYAKIANDPFYNTLISTYKNSNEKYGDRKLKFGIIPQASKNAPWLQGKYDQVKSKVQGAKELAKDKNLTKGQKITEGFIRGANFLLDSENYESASYMNFDGSTYKNVRSEFVNLLPEENVSLLLNETVVGMYRDANTFSTLREMQANAENLRMLVNGNAALNIEARKTLKVTRNGLSFDKLLGVPQTDKEAVRLNTQLQQNIDDIFYGISEFPAELKIGRLTINLNKLGGRLGFFTALNNMVLNINGAVSNVTIGNIMTLQERFGGRYLKKGSLRFGYSEYATNTANWFKDLNSPIKSKWTQIAIHYDAIQGEFRDKLGKSITGGLTSKIFKRGSLFFMNHAGEHQIQITQMIALMKSKEVKTKRGETISLSDAWVLDNNKIKLRDDIVWSKEDDAQFTRELHRINRALNGNYSEQHKSVAQRHWFGKAALIYRKYLYESIRARFAKERIDLESGDVILGYYRSFFKNLVSDISNMKFDVLKTVFTDGLVKSTKNLTEREQYAIRKTMFDLYLMVGIFALVKAAGDDDDDRSPAEAWTLLQLNRAYSDLAMYSIQSPAEISRQIQNPTAINRTLTNVGGVIQQVLVDPSETYNQSGNGYEQGDLKINTKLRKIVPIWNQIHRFANPEEQLQFFNLSNKRIYN